MVQDALIVVFTHLYPNAGVVMVMVMAMVKIAKIWCTGVMPEA